MDGNAKGKIKNDCRQERGMLRMGSGFTPSTAQNREGSILGGWGKENGKLSHF